MGRRGLAGTGGRMRRFVPAVLMAVLAFVAVPAPPAASEPPAAFAPPAEFKPEKRLRDQAELSFVSTGGNTEVTTFSLKNTLRYGFTERFSVTWDAAALYGKSDGEKNAERYATELRLDYALSERFYAFGNAGWRRDRFAGLEDRYVSGAGGGYRILPGPRHFLDGEIGLTYIVDRYTTGERQDFPSGRVFTRYLFAFTERSRFSQTVEFLHDFGDPENYNINTETAVTAALNSYLSLKMSYSVRYDNVPVPETLRRTDSAVSAALVFNY
jgi:putative salt-induced outer membrane protein